MIRVTLTAYNMGENATEFEFDAWANYVAAQAESFLGFEVQVDQYSFRGGPAEDAISGGTREQREVLCSALMHDLWDQACADSFVVQVAS
jgi:hypothetical protein